MIHLAFIGDSFLINSTPVELPMSLDALQRLLGPGRHSILEYNHVFAWDVLGLTASSKDGVTVEALLPEYSRRALPFMPRNLFSGTCTVDGVDVREYYRANRARRIKSSRSDRGGAFVFGVHKVYFSLDEGRISDIEISRYVPPTPAPDPLPLDPACAHYDALWSAWDAAVTHWVPANHWRHNLRHGITAQELADGRTAINTPLPPALVDFYKPRNVVWDPVSSPFSFLVNEWQYDLLPFADIPERHQRMMDLQYGPEIDPKLLADFSDRVKATDYANPAWIPFAEGRNGDYLLFDPDPSPRGKVGQIIELRNADWTRDVIADSLEELVRQEIARIAAAGTERFAFFLRDA